MPSDYGYINARIRAMKSYLLKKDEYLSALRQRTEDEFDSFLASLPSYANDFRKATSICPRAPARTIYDDALKSNMCRIFRKILNFSEGEPKRLIQNLLMAWDVYNLKTIVRGIMGSKDSLEIAQALMPAGKWDMEFLTRLARNRDLKGLADCLDGAGDDDLEKEFSRLIRDYSRTSSRTFGKAQGSPIEHVEDSLESAYFRKALESLSQKDMNNSIVLDYLTFKVDSLNILSVLKKIAKPTDQETRFIEGGSLQEAFLKSLMALKSIEDALTAFEGTHYAFLSREGLDLYRRTHRLSSLERLLKERLFKVCSNLYIGGDPLSIGIALAFINFKENEISNLRLVGKAIFYGVPEDLVRKELIYA